MTRSGRSSLGRTFGGSLIAQALLAAGATVPARAAVPDGAAVPDSWGPGSLHAYFVSPGDSSRPMRYTVAALADGPASALRQVTADQDGTVRMAMLTSFRRFRPGHGQEHQRPAPDVALGEPPAYGDEPGCTCTGGTHIPPCGLSLHDAPEPEITEPGMAPGAHRATWVRVRHELSEPAAGGAALWHSALLAYQSDIGTLGVVDKPHRDEPGQRRAASVDHAMWFHRPCRADGWLWYWQRSPVFTGGRGTFEGSFYDTAGRLVASCVQETAIRRTVVG